LGSKFQIARYTSKIGTGRRRDYRTGDVKNYRRLRSTDIKLRPDLNIIVGDNESGKSTLLEAINLALKGQINRRPLPQYELHPYLFKQRMR